MKLLVIDNTRSEIYLLHNVDGNYCDEPLLAELGFDTEMCDYMYLDDEFTFDDIKQADVKHTHIMVRHEEE